MAELNEKPLEGVTGGANIPDYPVGVRCFICDNCIGCCVHEGESGCPYVDKNAAYADRAADGSCRKQKKRVLD